MSPPVSALLTDLYELTMAHAYFQLGMRETAVFELFVRRLPPARRFLIAAGLAQVVDYLEGLRFSADDLAYLKELHSFPDKFLDHLAGVRFTGSLHAMPEGTPFFANEPILRVTAPILEAQLVESRILNLAHFQTVIASKAVRYLLAARGRRLVDFGMRRAHGAEAALLAARAAYLAGFDATATVEAGRLFGIPLSGTMAHSFIEAHDREDQALRNFLAIRPGDTTVLIDTYDTERAARRVVRLAHEPESDTRPGRILGVRIDSGDLSAQAQAVRRIFDSGGCRELQIILSGGLDEHRIERMLAAGTPVDAFGVGTNLDVSTDAPALDMAYKLQEYAGRARRKRSPGKVTWPGCKQVFRERDALGAPVGDSIALIDEPIAGTPLLREIMRAGQRVVDLPELTRIRNDCRQQLMSLPSPLRLLGETDAKESIYPVTISSGLVALADSFDPNEE
ncbi:MAG: nicotinate phosphoribosyltransferase [Steroidobacterales bacterium]